MIELVVFDMAGTTVDENNVVYRTICEAINAAGYARSQDEVQAIGAGKEKAQAIRDILALDGETPGVARVKEIFEDFRRRLVVAYEGVEFQGMPGSEEVFAALRSRGVTVALNTGYDRPTATGIITRIGWREGRDHDLLVTASDVANGRPAPDMILHAMNLAGVAESMRVAKIGDSAVDVEEGIRAGCGMTFGITTGAQAAEQLQAAGPTAVIHHLNELLPLILEPGARA